MIFVEELIMLLCALLLFAAGFLALELIFKGRKGRKKKKGRGKK